AAGKLTTTCCACRLVERSNVLPAMYVLLTISSESFHRMMLMRLWYRKLGIPASVSRNAPELLRGVRRSFGGRLILLDWANGHVIADKAIVGASGLDARGPTVVAGSWIDQCVYIWGRGAAASRLTHPWFNYIHSVDLTARNTLLLASAGSDLIVEI